MGVFELLCKAKVNETGKCKNEAQMLPLNTCGDLNILMCVDMCVCVATNPFIILVLMLITQCKANQTIKVAVNFC